MTEKTSSGPNRPHKSGIRNRAGKPTGNSSGDNKRTFNRRSGGNSRSGNRSIHKRVPAKKVPPLADGDIRVVPVSGVEWVTNNMTFVEYKDEIIIIDAGFGFPNIEQPGINYTIPDITYLKENKHKIKALVITHGHMDHVGAIPHIMGDLGNPPIYTREFGAMFIKSRMQEFKSAPKLNIHTIDGKTGYVNIEGSEHFKVKFFGLTHSIPDSTGIILQTPYGGIVSTGDVRVENVDGVPVKEEVDQYAFFKDENILLMTMDSTGVATPGWSPNEAKVRETLDGIIRDAKGRLLIGAFSSQVERLMSFLESAKKYGKYVIIEGRSMKTNLGIAEELKLTNFDHVIPLSEMDDHAPNKIVLIVTGAQGETYSALDRISRGVHRQIKLNQSDTVVLSSSVVPGNDYSVKKLKDQLYRGSYKIITHTDNTVHASGHGKREELKWLHTQIPYKFFMPIHGDHYMVKMHAMMVEKELGVSPENIIVPDNGSIIEIRENGTKFIKLKEKVPAKIIVRDGNYLGPQHDAVIKDRMTLSQDGIFVVVAMINQRTKKLKKSPDIISRGFVYLKENHELLNETRDLIRKTIEDSLEGKKNIEFDKLKEQVSKTVGKFLVRKTDKEPVVIPVILTA